VRIRSLPLPAPGSPRLGRAALHSAQGHTSADPHESIPRSCASFQLNLMAYLPRPSARAACGGLEHRQAPGASSADHPVASALATLSSQRAQGGIAQETERNNGAVAVPHSISMPVPAVRFLDRLGICARAGAFSGDCILSVSHREVDVHPSQRANGSLDRDSSSYNSLEIARSRIRPFFSSRHDFGAAEADKVPRPICGMAVSLPRSKSSPALPASSPRMTRLVLPGGTPDRRGAGFAGQPKFFCAVATIGLPFIGQEVPGVTRHVEQSVSCGEYPLTGEAGPTLEQPLETAPRGPAPGGMGVAKLVFRRPDHHRAGRSSKGLKEPLAPCRKIRKSWCNLCAEPIWRSQRTWQQVVKFCGRAE